MKIKQLIRIIICIFVGIFLVFGVPIIINECYKTNSGYMTVWSGSDVLSYYGTILGSIIAVTTLAVTIIFTKKQLQRETFLKNESAKWDKLKDVFLQTLDNINPMKIFKDVFDNGYTNPSEAISMLQKYQLSCKTANDQLIANISKTDEPKFKELISNIVLVAEDFLSIIQKEINQYSDLRIWQNRDNIVKMDKIEKASSENSNNDEPTLNEQLMRKLKNISYEKIDAEITMLNNEIIKKYETDYRALLYQVGSTFDDINLETQQKADNILLFNTKKARKVHNRGKEKS